MRMTRPLLAAGLLLSLTTLNAEANNLSAYNAAGGVGVVFDRATNITWTADANLLGTLESQYAASHGGSYTGLINTIINASVYNGVQGVIHDTANAYDKPTANSGIYTLSASDFGSGGKVTWWGATAYVNYLNSISYGGSHQWGLPSTNPQSGYNQTSSQLGELYYNELNKLAYPGTNYSNFGILGNGQSGTSGSVGPFSNAQSYAYWSGTEYASNPYDAWVFYTYFGTQGTNYKGNQFYAWAVSPGQVNAVPVPGAVWLFGTGLVGLAGLKRRGHAG